MEMYITKQDANHSFFFDEELDIFATLIEDKIIVDDKFFSFTDNMLAFYTIKPTASPVAERNFTCYGERSTEYDRKIAYALLAQFINIIVESTQEIEEDLCQLTQPVLANNMIVMMGYIKFDDMYAFMVVQTNMKFKNAIYTTCATLCYLIHAAYIILCSGEETLQPEDVLLDGYVDKEISNLVLESIKYWFCSDNPVLTAWHSRLQQESENQNKEDE